MSSAGVIGFAAVVVFGAMIGEAVRSAQNDRALRSAGAIEPAGDVYRVMQLAYPGCFVGMLLEGALRGAGLDAAFAVGSAIFIVGKLLKYWAIASLGTRWTFRVLVPPGSARTRCGPYRWLAHPNYVGVAGELIGAAVALHAFLTGPLAVIGFSWLMIRRAVVEEKALAGE